MQKQEQKWNMEETVALVRARAVITKSSDTLEVTERCFLSGSASSASRRSLSGSMVRGWASTGDEPDFAPLTATRTSDGVEPQALLRHGAFLPFRHLVGGATCHVFVPH